MDFCVRVKVNDVIKNIILPNDQVNINVFKKTGNIIHRVLYFYFTNIRTFFSKKQ